MSDAPPHSGPAAPPVPQKAAVSAAPASGSTVAPASVAEQAPKDVVFLGPPTADGGGVHILRARDERLETGELRPLQEGRPIVGEIVTLKPREFNPRVCDVTESYAPRTAQPAPLGRKGPAKVASQAYRAGWDEIFGSKPRRPEPTN